MGILASGLTLSCTIGHGWSILTTSTILRLQDVMATSAVKAMSKPQGWLCSCNTLMLQIMRTIDHQACSSNYSI